MKGYVLAAVVAAAAAVVPIALRQPASWVAGDPMHVFGEIWLGVNNASIIAEAAAGEMQRVLSDGPHWTDVTQPTEAANGIRVQARALNGDMNLPRNVLITKATAVLSQASLRATFSVLGSGGMLRCIHPLVEEAPVAAEQLGALRWPGGGKRGLAAESAVLKSPFAGVAPREFLLLRGDDPDEHTVFRKSIIYQSAATSARRVRAVGGMYLQAAAVEEGVRVTIAAWVEPGGWIPGQAYSWLTARADGFYSGVFERLVVEERRVAEGGVPERPLDFLERHQKLKDDDHPLLHKNRHKVTL